MFSLVLDGAGDVLVTKAHGAIVAGGEAVANVDHQEGLLVSTGQEFLLQAFKVCAGHGAGV